MTDDYTLQVAQGRVWILTIGAETVGVVVIKPEAGHMLLENVAVTLSCTKCLPAHCRSVEKVPLSFPPTYRALPCSEQLL